MTKVDAHVKAGEYGWYDYQQQKQFRRCTRRDTVQQRMEKCRRAVLKGIGALDLTHAVSRPLATFSLAMMRAETIKIENPGTRGDVSRVNPLWGNVSLRFCSLIHNTAQHSPCPDCVGGKVNSYPVYGY